MLESARTGNLHLALDRAEIDRPLLNGAAGIIRALIQGGPADSIDDYQDAPVAIQRYVNHVLKAEDLDLGHFLCVSEILQFVPADEGWEPRSSNSGVGSIPIVILTNKSLTGSIILSFFPTTRFWFWPWNTRLEPVPVVSFRHRR